VGVINLFANRYKIELPIKMRDGMFCALSNL